MQKKIGFIGLGLIGGSVAKAIRTYYPDYEIVAYDQKKENLALAISEGIVNTACSSVDDSFTHCHYIFLCAPVSYNSTYLKELIPYLWDELVITDVGSVKTSIHQEVERLELEPYFIGGHPMAGSEKTGYENSKAHLIENAYYVLTPTTTVSQTKVDAYENFVSTLKGIPVILDYNEHDYVTGAISHLPHIIASSLVNFIKESDNEAELMKMLAAGGFKDITRIASSSPTMWEHICVTNKNNISEILTSYICMLEDAKRKVDASDGKGIYEMFESSKDYRNSISEGSAGPIQKVYAVYCDIIDETGGIATIATILASNNISLKNIGIVHNREFEEGVLRIEFYEEEASVKAAELLKKYRYIVYER